MGIFGNLTTEGLEESQDRLGGFSLFESDIYIATIKMAYVTKARNSAAQAVHFIFDIDGKEYRETMFVTNKEGKNYFINKNNKKSPLPGFTTVNEICLCAADKSLDVVDTPEKTVKIYNYDTKTEEPTRVPVIIDLIDKKVALGILKRTVNKREKQGDTYVSTNETRDENAIDKVFHAELKVTVPEARHGKEPTFWNQWLEKNKGVTQNRTKAAEGKPSVSGSTGTQNQPAKSLFNR